MQGKDTISEVQVFNHDFVMMKCYPCLFVYRTSAICNRRLSPEPLPQVETPVDIPALLCHCWDEPTIQSSKHHRQPRQRINAIIFISSTFTAPTLKPTGHSFKFDLRPKGLAHHQEAEISRRLTTIVAVPLAERICRLFFSMTRTAHPTRKQHCLQDKTLRQLASHSCR